MAEYLHGNESQEERSSGRFLQTENESQKEKIFPQLLAGITANLTAVITGTIIAWTSPSLPKLEGPDSPIPITKTQNSWITSLMPLAGAFGPFAAGFLAKKYGRKSALLYSAGPALVSWLCLAFGFSVEVVYVARFTAGFTVGWIFTVLPMYCGEIASKSVRGAIGSLMQVFIDIGLLFDYCLGPYISYAWLSLGAAIVPLVFVMIFVWMPESPYYLLMKEDKKSAEKALQWLRGMQVEDVRNELLEIQLELQRRRKEKQNELEELKGPWAKVKDALEKQPNGVKRRNGKKTNVEKTKSESGSFKDLFATRGNIKALIISLGLVGFQQLSGINVVLFNTQSIFEKSGGTFKPEVSTIITGIIMLVASVVTPLVADKAGRKMLLLISAIGMALAQGVLGLCFFLEKKGSDMSSFNFLSILAVLVYITTYCLGFGPLPWTVMGEMFPGSIKPLASTLTASFCWVLGFIVTRFFNDIVETFGTDYSFWMFSVFCLLAGLFVQVLLIETKEKSFNEIQELLNRS